MMRKRKRKRKRKRMTMKVNNRRKGSKKRR